MRVWDEAYMSQLVQPGPPPDVFDFASGIGSPEGTVIGKRRGQIYTDVLTGAIYLFVGTVGSSHGWTGTAEGNVLAYGADPTGRTPSDTAFTNAFTAMSNLGLPLRIPPGTYSLTPGTFLSMASIPYVSAFGATIKEAKVIMAGTDQSWFGGKFTTAGVGVNAEGVFDITGTNIRVDKLTIDYSNQSGGVSVEAYCALEINTTAKRVKITNFDFWVASRVGIAVNLGNDITISQGTIHCTDDGIALKGALGTLKGVRISDVEVIGGANIVAFGTETTLLTDVTVTNCTATECQTAIWIKPGKIGYANAILKNVTISGITCNDPLGLRYQRAIYITTLNGAIISNLVISNVVVDARCASTSVARAFVHVRPNAGTVKDVSITGCRFKDSEAAADPGTNGFPVLFGLYIENVTASTIENILFDDIVVDGTGGAAYIDDPGTGTNSNIRLHHLRCRNNVTTTGSAVISANINNVYIDDNLVIESALALPLQAATTIKRITAAVILNGGAGYTAGDIITVAGGTGTAATILVVAVSAGVITSVAVRTVGAYTVAPSNPVSVTGGTGAGATFTAILETNTIQASRENIRVKDLAAGVSWASLPLMSFKRKSWISRISILSSSDVVVDVTDYTTLIFINSSLSAGMTLLATNATPIANNTTITTEANSLAVAASIMDANSVVRLSKLESGTGKAVNDLIISIDYVPFGV